MPLQLFSIFLSLSPLLSSALTAKPGCPDRCGDLPIPYPFGVGSGCSLDPYFSISCNSSTVPPKPYLSIINKQVVEINSSFIRLNNPYQISACYNLSENERMNVNATGEDSNSMMVNLTATPFTLSYANRLTAIGCDDVVRQSNGSAVSGGCSAICADKNDTGGVGYCPFNASKVNGCCEAEITPGTTMMGADLSDVSGKLGRGKIFPCSYAFIRETVGPNETMFSYPLNYLHNSTALPENNWASSTRPPVVRLDWIIGAHNCTRAKLNFTAYACQDSNSVCVDDNNNGRGYMCSCVQGFEGNPYLPGGCQKTSSSNSISKFGCSRECGKLPIAFPFGIGPGCYLAPSFEVLCNSSAVPPKAYLRVLNAEIVWLNSSKVWVKYQHLASTCYNLSDYQRGITEPVEKQSLTIDLVGTQYTLSDENWITAVGCDDMVVAVVGKDKGSSIRSSCAAICSNRQIGIARCPYVTDMYSPGDGCCRAPIPRGTTYLEANMSDLGGRRPRANFSCSYAVVEYIIYDQFYFNSYGFANNLTGIKPDVVYPDMTWGPIKLALDWRIGLLNCEEARHDPATFACQANTDCVDFDATVEGYLCNCSQGYQGNPYLSPGCQDIDECADNTTNPCDSMSFCMNTPGSVNCLCPKGYYGDGRKDGRGCVQLPPSKSKMIILTGLGSGLGFLLLLLMCLWLYKMLKRRKERILKEKFFKRNGGLLLQQQTKEGAIGKPKTFLAKELEVATDNFNENRVLGHGGQGTVYKGMLPDGTIVAIKKSKLVEEDQVDQFINEVVILSQISHRNVVKLLGCCLETEVPMLVYEFMANGTLFDLIHDPSNEFPVSWSLRLKIATDIACALAYLHSSSSLAIYHRDIKSTNILLDEKYVVKVSDFGTSRSVAVDQTHLTTLVKGTFGYLDPEYFQSSHFTEKSDVYSFGVVLVELLTGQRPVSLDRTDNERNLASRFLTCIEENCLDTILDPQVMENSRKEEVILVAKLAERCLNLKGIMRPTMKEVASELESFRISQISTIVEDEREEAREFEANPVMFSDIDYTWTASYKSASASSIDSHPLILSTDA